MGLFGKLFGSNDYNANEPQGHLKTKNYRRLDWEIDDNEYKKQDYIASSEYIIPSNQTVIEVFDKLNSGEEYVVNDVFFRVDYMGRPDDWHKQRDYVFNELTLAKKEKTDADDKDIYVLGGSGTFLKEDFTGRILETETNDVSVSAEVTYKNNMLIIQNGNGFEDTDNWYAFMILFKILEYYKYPTEKCKTVSINSK
ncbi:hypothetical protein [Methanimicrococcus blatticola]|uniref:Uncharacterized protein n=1 Tax=Methanimicrococcus blatticola TaxID=91560 RepID=A0A484F2W8_9EURY|nr:hypothetical protein [Methanimicrococcus blatticola]MBZ3936095.1 hypothetical protein [Methanimicrococcus blatticola]MCC2509297.1 hypothetical protein [Methanimicrococcus blatticola]TDQ68184.1 hypothetical protein C7391_1121 [Methanimicrococcus blatticola]